MLPYLTGVCKSKHTFLCIWGYLMNNNMHYTVSKWRKLYAHTRLTQTQERKTEEIIIGLSMLFIDNCNDHNSSVLWSFIFSKWPHQLVCYLPCLLLSLWKGLGQVWHFPSVYSYFDRVLPQRPPHTQRQKKLLYKQKHFCKVFVCINENAFKGVMSFFFLWIWNFYVYECESLLNMSLPFSL